MSRGYRRYVLIVLTLVYTLNLVDRGLMMLLLQPIKEDLQLSDTQLGLLTGIAFGLFYATLGLPIARLADRSNRVTITSAAIGLWGLTMAACLLVSNFVHLLLARIAAAVGESGCKPPTYSLVGDYFTEPSERTRAMAVYLTGSALATLLAFLLGGWLNELYGWRLTFLLMGVPGLLLAIVVRFTIIEPRASTAAGSAHRMPLLKDVTTFMWQQRSFRHMTAALILFYTMGLGLAPWYAAFLMRTHHMETTEVGLWLGVILSASALFGVLAGGYIASRWLAGNERGQMRLSAVALLMVVPCFLGVLLFPDKHHALMSFIPLMIVFQVFIGPVYALMQRLVADEMRATTMALVMLLANLLGMGVAPQVVGILSDAFTPKFGADGLRYAMLAMSFVAFWSSYHFWRVAASIEADLAKMEKAPAGAGFSIRREVWGGPAPRPRP